EVRLFLRREHHAVGRAGRIGRAKINSHKILSHQAGEFDDSLAVRLHHGVGMKFHRDLDLVAGERDFFDTANLHTGHFNTVADLQILHRVEQGVEAVAAVEGFHAAERFHDEEGGEDDENDKYAQAGFK